MSDSAKPDIYDAVIADLESKISALQLTIDNLRNVRAFTGLPTATVVKPLPSPGPGSFPHDAFFQMTAADAAKKYLSAVKRTASATTIADALVEGGWKSASKNVAEIVRTTLSRNPEFIRVNSEFGLADWYPGRKLSGPRRERTPVTHEAESESSFVEVADDGVHAVAEA